MDDWIAGFLTGMLVVFLLPTLFGTITIGVMNNGTGLAKFFMTCIILILIILIWIINKE